MSGELIYVSTDDHGKLVALLDERRQMFKRHERERNRKRASRYQGGLAEKLSERSRHKAELDGLNRQIEELTIATGGSK